MVATTSELRSRKRLADSGFRILALASGVLVLAILALIAVTVTREAWPAFDLMGIEFFTSDDWNPPANQFGALAFIYGTLISSAIAITLALPVSVGIALFVTQVAPRWLRRPIVYVMDLLAVIPSVVFGLWGVLVFSKQIVNVYDWISSAVEDIPVLHTIFGPPQGRSFFTAGIILAIMITPIITSLAREVIDTTPPGDREAALALGATRWEMIRGAVIPHSKGGLVGASMLGLGRAMGETVAAALVIGSTANITLNLFSPGDSMPAVITFQWGESEGTYKAALLALAVVLFAITIIVNLIANAIVQRSMRKSMGV